MFINLKRIFRFAWQSFSRNKGLSLQVLFIMAVAVFTLTSLFIFKDLSNFLIAKAEKKVDISVYFKKDTKEDEILLVREGLSNFSKEIENIDYVSKEKAKEIFLERHKDDPLYLEALKEVEENPFLSSLDIKAKNPALYAQISNFLTEGPFQVLVEKVSYYQSEKVIERLFALTSNIKTAGLFLSFFLIILVFLITFNTVKLTIFAFRDEISTMRLVGASSWFIRGPFLIQGFLYGILSILTVDVLFLLSFAFLNSDLQTWLFDFNLLEYFQKNFLTLLLWQILFAFLLGGISSFLAIRRYLKI